MVRRFAGVACLALALLGSAGHQVRTPQACAARLGISWSIDAGATDRLDAFAACVR